MPPFIEHADSAEDRERYQTVYACNAGALAGPTDGQHFDAVMQVRLEAMGKAKFYVALRVGSETFQHLRLENRDEHRNACGILRGG